MAENDLVSVCYMVDDTDESIQFYTRHFGFTLRTARRRRLPRSSAAGCACCWPVPRARPGGPCPTVAGPGGWNRIHFVVDDIAAEVARLRSAGLSIRNDVVTGLGGQQILLDDPSGNPIELFQPGR